MRILAELIDRAMREQRTVRLDPERLTRFHAQFANGMEETIRHLREDRIRAWRDTRKTRFR